VTIPPAGTSEARVESSASITEPSTTMPGPPINEALAELIPHVAGFFTQPATDVYWPAYDLPGGSRAYAAVVSAGDERIGQLVIADGAGPNRLPATYLTTLFRDGVRFLRDPLNLNGPTAYVGTTAPVSWQAVNEAAVVTSIDDVDGLGAWTWEHENRIWVVKGQLAEAGQYAEAVIEATGAGADPFDFQGLHGWLPERIPDVPGHRYVDRPRPTLLDELANTASGDCTESAYYGYVVDETEPDRQVMVPEDLGLMITTFAPPCAAGGAVDDLTARLAADPKLSHETMGGRAVYRSANEVFRVDGRVIVHFSSGDPATIAAMAPFLAEFFTAF
jgi:hypothetical protein